MASKLTPPPVFNETKSLIDYEIKRQALTTSRKVRLVRQAWRTSRKVLNSEDVPTMWVKVIAFLQQIIAAKKKREHGQKIAPTILSL